VITLEQATTPRGGTLEVPAGWRQGRGAYGGLVIAAMARAIDDRVADPTRMLRSLTAELPAPVEAGRAELAVEILRHGKAVTTARASLVQAGEVRAHAVGILAAARPEAPAWNELVPPEAPPWAALAPLATPAVFPEFARHFDYRIVEGVPMAGGAPRTVGWIRPLAPGACRDAAYIAAVVDAWYPAALVRLSQMRPMATIAYTLDVFALPGDEPLLYRGTVPVAADGYFVETRELWTADRRLVALNHQTFAVIR
jgi:acyl-CoA thioesterase